MNCRAILGLSLVVLLSFVAPAQADDKGLLRAGAAASNITPPIGLPIIGGFVPVPSTHIHDELNARCLVLDDGKQKIALVVCDLLALSVSVSEEARRLIESTTGILPSHVLISATHTHSASGALGQNRFQNDAAPDDYQKFVATRIADGVRRACNTLRPAELAFGQVDIPEHLNNRRWFMRPGTMPENPFGDAADLVKMNPPAGSPNLLEPAGPIDPQASFLAVREPDGKPISVWAAYSLHYVGAPGEKMISADYYGVFCDELAHLLEADRLDPPFVAAMANGTSGDINNINFRNPRPRKPPFEQTRYVAKDVAAKIQGAMQGLKYRRDVTLDARYREAPVVWRRPTAEQVAWAKKTRADPQSAPNRTISPVYAERFLKLAEYPETGTVPVQVLRIGEVCIGTLPCEVFAETGLEFKRRSPLKPAFLVELSHGSFGYLPTPRQFDLGGYETWLGTSRLERTTSEKLMAQLLEMATEMKTASP
jgi:neutral ceramidase